MRRHVCPQYEELVCRNVNTRHSPVVVILYTRSIWCDSIILRWTQICKLAKYTKSEKRLSSQGSGVAFIGIFSKIVGNSLSRARNALKYDDTSDQPSNSNVFPVDKGVGQCFRIIRIIIPQHIVYIVVASQALMYLYVTHKPLS